MEWERPGFLEIRMDAELTYVNDLEPDEAAPRAATGPDTPTSQRPADASPAG